MKRLFQYAIVFALSIVLMTSCASYRNLVYDMGEYRFTIVDEQGNGVENAFAMGVLTRNRKEVNRRGSFMINCLSLPMWHLDNKDEARQPHVAVVHLSAKMRRPDYFLVGAFVGYKYVKIPYRKSMERDITVVLEVDSATLFPRIRR